MTTEIVLLDARRWVGSSPGSGTRTPWDPADLELGAAVEIQLANETSSRRQPRPGCRHSSRAFTRSWERRPYAHVQPGGGPAPVDVVAAGLRRPPGHACLHGHGDPLRGQADGRGPAPSTASARHDTSTSRVVRSTGGRPSGCWRECTARGRPRVSPPLPGRPRGSAGPRDRGHRTHVLVAERQHREPDRLGPDGTWERELQGHLLAVRDRLGAACHAVVSSVIAAHDVQGGAPSSDPVPLRTFSVATPRCRRVAVMMLLNW